MMLLFEVDMGRWEEVLGKKIVGEIVSIYVGMDMCFSFAWNDNRLEKFPHSGFLRGIWITMTFYIGGERPLVQKKLSGAFGFHREIE